MLHGPVRRANTNILTTINLTPCCRVLRAFHTMSRDQPSDLGSGFDFSFPSLAPAQAPQGPQPAQNPFGIQPPAAPKQPVQQPAQVQLQQPVRPMATSEPLTARSTVVHASSSRPAGSMPQQQSGAEQPAMAQKPVPLSQVCRWYCLHGYCFSNMQWCN
jgi:hypothetical protein